MRKKKRERGETSATGEKESTNNKYWTATDKTQRTMDRRERTNKLDRNE